MTPKRTTIKFHPGIKLRDPFTGDELPVKRFTLSNDGEDSVAAVHGFVVVTPNGWGALPLLRYVMQFRRQCMRLLAGAKAWSNN
ncbi:MAG TPA: hypothetical protein DGH68_02025 [Bacteroidetes bacterium]|jgi:hypothetical protein|nr:hypothetical protein [Bacteroidota bacterium]